MGAEPGNIAEWAELAILRAVGSALVSSPLLAKGMAATGSALSHLLEIDWLFWLVSKVQV